MYPQVFGKYVLERELSRGGMARVVLATLRGAGGFEKKLVVKQIRDELAYDQQFVRRFVEEAKTTVALSHPNIVPVYELGQEQGTYFLAMELVEGLSIAELLRERNEDGSRRVLTPEEGAYVGVEVCRALDYAHRRMKVVHRDITPRNVMLDEEGQVKLIDFGIAAPARVAGHEILGSPGHMPPEQVDGKELGPATDIFALAVLLMEAWSGVAPFRRPTPEECDAAMREPHPKPSDFDPRLIPLDDAISRAMKLDPRERQQDAAELGKTLRAFLKGIDTSDIARALGDRVRDARGALSSSDPTSRQSDAGDARTAMPSAGDLGTKTFAARDEALRWSSPPPSGEAGAKSSVPPDAPSTRKLRESVAPPPPRGRKDDPAMAIPTPLMVEPAGELPPTVRRKKVERPPGKAKADELETIATRPLETPVRKSAAPAPPPAEGPRPRPWLVPAVAAAAAVGGLLVWRASATPDGPKTPTSTPTAITATTATTAVSTATTAAPTTTVTAPSSAVSVVAPPGTAPSPPVSNGAGATGAPPSSAGTSASASEKQGRAVVSLVGDPGTRVSVDGASRGACPVKVTLDPGPHEVRFIFDPTGESRGERLNVKAGDKVTVRAEFTGATPTVKISR